jgi:hypothetical protein
MPHTVTDFHRGRLRVSESHCHAQTHGVCVRAATRDGQPQADGISNSHNRCLRGTVPNRNL